VAGLLARLQEVEPAPIRQAIAGLQKEVAPVARAHPAARGRAAASGPRWAPFSRRRPHAHRAVFEGLEFRSLLPAWRAAWA
jgi:hypothetical protein